MTERSVADEFPEIAYYYPGPVWVDGDWVKNLLLFFDGIALLVPEYMHDRVVDNDPALAVGLKEHNLLTVLTPETFIDKRAARSLAKSMTNIIASGTLDKLAGQRTKFYELSYSRLGYMADAGLADKIHRELEKRNLALPTQDGVSIPMHPTVRSLILVLLAQILRTTGRKKGLVLWPATDVPKVHRALAEFLRQPSVPSAGHVVSFDMKTVGVDLRAVPLDEILDFRREHRTEYRKYAHDLRRFVREIASLTTREQSAALKHRKAEIAEQAEGLSQAAVRAWRKRASFALGLAGAVWRLSEGDVVGGLLSLGAGTVAAELSPEEQAGAFSYLFRARESFW